MAADIKIDSADTYLDLRPAAADGASFDVTEKSIVELQAALAEGRTTAKGLVEQYLARISAYDKAGPFLNAIVCVNPLAIAEAEALDRERLTSGPRGPLHGIPVLVKDNFETKDLPTTGGSLALAAFQPDCDAFQVRRLREAGAIVLGKTTLHELAAGITTISSLTGSTRNPYSLDRVPGGSSGGTAAAVAASLAAAGMGSDSCGSIRIPAANQNLYGLRVTRGLSSRSGIIPLSPTQDEAGPLTRSVGDLALMLDATVGPDPDDPVTALGAGEIPSSYFDLLAGAAFSGKRIGVLTCLFEVAPEDAELADVVRGALEQMRGQGAELVEVAVPELESLMADGNVISHEFKFALADYLARHPHAPVKSLQDILDRGLYHTALEAVFRLRNRPVERDTPIYREALQKQIQLKERVVALMQRCRLDAIAYPVLRRRVARIGEAQTGITAQLSANTGLPALSVPVGITSDGVPVGMELLGGPFQEAALLRLGRAWEVAASPRRAPFSTPPLAGGAAPGPLRRELNLSAGNGARVHVALQYDPTTGRLQGRTAVSGVPAREVLGVTLQRGRDDQPGPVVHHLVELGQLSGRVQIQLDAPGREALLGGHLFVHFYTRAAPVGAGRVRVAWSCPGPENNERVIR